MSANELPKKFEEFGEARRLGFLKAKEHKDKGGSIPGGHDPTYLHIKSCKSTPFGRKNGHKTTVITVRVQRI